MADDTTEFGRQFWKVLTEAFLAVHRAARELHLGQAEEAFHFDYPRMNEQEGRMPYFESGPNWGVLPHPGKKYYTRPFDRVRNMLALAALGGRKSSEELPEIEKLQRFVQQEEYFKKWKQLSRPDYAIVRAIIQAVERYFHLHGTGEPDEQKWSRIVADIFDGFTQPRLPLSIVVPLLFTSFEVNRFRIAPQIMLIKMPQRLQLARSRMPEIGSGATKQVVGSATHALVFAGWDVENGGPENLVQSLSLFGGDAEDIVERVLGCLRLSTGITTGYAQVLYCPRHWAIDYFCDLPPVYGAIQRRYPGDFDNFGWTRLTPEVVTRRDLENTKTIFRRLQQSSDRKIKLALRRLNNCFTRESDTDAILDATIGLELLLADGHEALSYKIRMRAAGLAALRSEKLDPSRVYKDVQEIYSARSAIVHGSEPTRSERRDKKPSSIAKSSEVEAQEMRHKAVKYLRTVLRARLELPEIKKPQDIDQRFLIAFAFNEMARQDELGKEQDEQ